MPKATQAVCASPPVWWLISQADPGFDATDPSRSPLRDPKTLVETDGLDLDIRQLAVNSRFELAFPRHTMVG